MARLHGADAEDAEDAVQEAMLRAAEHPEIADDRLQAWLVAVTTRLCIDDHRRRVNEVSRWKRASGQAVIEQPGQAVEEEACERSEAAWVASLATELLPPRQVRALELAAEGCDVQQVATNLGVRYRAAESLLARARRTLRTAITASLGVAAWTWRSQWPGVSGNVVPVGLASAAAATIIVIIPPVVSYPERAEPAPTAPSATQFEPDVAGVPGRTPAPTASAPADPAKPNGGLSPTPHRPAPGALLTLPRVDPPSPRLPPALPPAVPISPPTLPRVPSVQSPIEQVPSPPSMPFDQVPPFRPQEFPPFQEIPWPDPDNPSEQMPDFGIPMHP